MRKKKILRHLTDLTMTVLLLVLMAYSLTGQAVHEWLGIVLFALFVFHHLLNLQWFRALRKGRYAITRILQTGLVALLFLSVLAQTVSGIAMSRHALLFLDIPLSTSAARLIHLSCGYWCFLLASLHLGFHWSMFLAMGRKLREGRPLPATGRNTLRVAAAVTAIYGAVCFVRQNIVDYLFLRTEFVFFDYEKPPAFVLMELLAIMCLWTLAGYFLWRITLFCVKRSKQEN